MKPKLPMVAVDWADTMAVAGWHSMDEAAAGALTRVTTVGYLVKKDAHRVVLAQSLAEEAGDVGEIVTIPRGAVLKLRELR